MKALINGKIILENSVMENKILIYDKKIEGIVDADKFDRTHYLEIIDAECGYVSPGFIDIHIHGFMGADTMDASHESLDKISYNLALNGITSFLPTTMTMSGESIKAALKCIREKIGNEKGANIIGANLEGPYISADFCGAHDKKYIKKPDMEIIKEFKDVIKIVTYAPEKDVNNKFLKGLNNLGIKGAIGHTGATYEETIAAVEEGANHITHIFNAMETFHHRRAGALLAGLNSRAVCEVIADNVHISKELYQTIIKIKGIDKVVIISDAVSAAKMPCGEYMLGGQKIYVTNKGAFLENGTIAGSIIPINKSILNIIANTDLKIFEAVKMVTENPAKAAGVFDKKGSLDTGKDADIIVFDEKINVKKVIIGGGIVKDI